MVTYDSSLGTALLSDPVFAKPTSFRAFAALPKGFVMQDVVCKNGGTFFVSQGPGVPASENKPGIFNTIINRISYDTGQTLDVMELTYGGHGLGFEVEYSADGHTYIWMTWQGADNSNDFVAFPYKPGTYTRAQVEANGYFNKFGVQDDPEAVYHFDWQNDLAVERHFEFDGSGETYKVRHISDIRNGVNTVYNQFKVPTNPPTVQGFAIMQNSLFRYNGTAIDNNTPNSGDPVRIEQYRVSDYAANYTGYGTPVATRTYQTSTSNSISSNGTVNNKPTWRDGHFEAEGMSVFREADGTYSLIIGDTTGNSGNHAWHVTKFSGVGKPNGR